ncbi:hypothetical protein LTR27_010770 [Elasticomyces elasticus]|nr:hypothetical protein LTR27_010770 [Elasticomyces elasticus]
MPSFHSTTQRLQNLFSSQTNSKATSTNSTTSLKPTSPSTKNSTMSAPVVLILGSGPRVGAAVSKAFAASGYKVAAAARKGTDAKTDEGYLSIKADFAEPKSITAVYNAVKAEFGAAPSIVVYNTGSLTPPPDKDSVLSISADRFTHDLNVNTVAPFVAAQEAIKGWATISAGAKVFIYTGNALNKLIMPVPMMLDVGVGKAASAYWLGQADGAYSANGYRFIYADERQPDGKMKGLALDGPAHGTFYTQLAKSTEGIPWNATFVKDQGYVSFE